MRAVSSITCAALLLALPASAAELDLSVRFQTEYSDNVLSDGNDKRDDLIFTLAPEGRIKQRNGEIRWEVGYKPSYVTYLDANGIDGWQHALDGNASWQVTERTSIQVFDRYSQLLSRSRFNQQITIEDEVVTETELGVTQYTRNVFSASVNHLLDRGHSLRGQLAHSFTDFESSRDTSSISLNLSYRYQLSPRSLLSLGPRYSRQEVEGAGTLDDTGTDFYGITGTWQHVLDRGLNLSLSAGPTWIESDSGSTRRATEGATPIFPLRRDGQNLFFADAVTCPEFPDTSRFFSGNCATLGNPAILVGNNTQIVSVDPGAPTADEKRLTFFADASIEKRWQRWSSSFSYRRQESPSSGLGSAAITDSVSGTLNWRPAPRWNLRWVATFLRRTQANEGITPRLRVAPCIPGDLTVPCEGAPDGAARTVAIRFAPVDTDNRLDQVVGRFAVTYRLRDRITLDGNLFYLDQTQSGDNFVTDQNVSRFTAWFGIRWALDPIPLPF